MTIAVKTVTLFVNGTVDKTDCKMMDQQQKAEDKARSKLSPKEAAIFTLMPRTA